MREIEYKAPLLEFARIKDGDDELVLIDLLEGRALEGFFKELFEKTPKGEMHKFAFYVDFDDLCCSGDMEGLNNMLDGAMDDCTYTATDISYIPLAITAGDNIIIRVDCILEEL